MGLKQATAITAILMSPLAGADAKDWEGEVELGVLKTTGNTEETNVNGRLGLVHEVTEWRNIGNFRSAYSEAQDETTAERYRAELETNYKFDEHHYVFLRGSYEDDRFSGYDFQSSSTAGYGNRFLNWGERSFLDLSAGLGYRYNKLEVPDDDGNREEEEAIARLAAQFDFALSETSLFRQKLSTEIGLDDNNVITESETSIQASVVGNLSLKVAYRVEHVSDAPPDSDDTDTETSLSLLYGF
ncbi:YdiY family protein [Marinobacter sp.]|uniref:YdiY family protein n=1 Tax=Marinobacter sp. TaxID=50741 RepID=UPI0034A4FE2A